MFCNPLERSRGDVLTELIKLFYAFDKEGEKYGPPIVEKSVLGRLVTSTGNMKGNVLYTESKNSSPSS